MVYRFFVLFLFGQDSDYVVFKVFVFCFGFGFFYIKFFFKVLGMFLKQKVCKVKVVVEEKDLIYVCGVIDIVKGFEQKRQCCKEKYY